MHPNSFLQSLWRTQILDQVFVAMSFDPRFNDRFYGVIRPAIEDQPLAGRQITAFRVDNSKSGDSILTEIISGIAHSRLVLADVSIVDEGRFTQEPVRNSNVMYEVGIALACRTPSEVLLIRDDTKKFLFDVSTIPHMLIDFTDKERAILELRSALEDRLKETKHLHDARVQMLARTMTQDELRILRALATLEPDQARDLSIKALGQLSAPDARGVGGLLNKGCIRSIAVNAESGSLFYALTPFGRILVAEIETLLATVTPEPLE